MHPLRSTLFARQGDTLNRPRANSAAMAQSAQAAPEGALAIDFDRIADRLKPLGNATRLRLLRFLTQPHYLEEIASHLKMNRTAAKKHVDELLAIGLLRTLPGRRESGPVRDYLVAPEAFFELYDAVRALGEIRPAPETYAQTLPGLLSKTRPTAAARNSSRAASPFPYLVVVYGTEIGHAFGLVPRRDGDAPWVIGRDAQADIVVETDPFVSNRHGRIVRQGPDYVLTDAFSTNGTWVNWQRLPAGGSVPLQRGDIVGVGKTLLVFRRDTPND